VDKTGKDYNHQSSFHKGGNSNTPRLCKSRMTNDTFIGLAGEKTDCTA